MQKIHIKNTSLKDTLSELNTSLGGILEEVHGTYTLTLDGNKNTGIITAIDFDWGIFLIDFNVNFSEITEISFVNDKEKIVEIIFISDGSLVFKEESEDTHLNLSRHQSIIISSKFPSNKVFIFAKDADSKVTLICFEGKISETEEPSENHPFKAKLSALIENLDFEDRHIYLGTRTAKIEKQIKSLFAIDKKDETAVLKQLEKLIHTILANRIEQLYLKYKKPELVSSLKEDELKSVIAITESIKENPQEPYTISMLSDITSLSPAKLQEGFKIVSNRTVSDFIRHVRLLEAEKLIRNSNLNISEIIYSVGFSSRSYFCKIFKKRYGCSPKKYQSKVKAEAESDL